MKVINQEDFRKVESVLKTLPDGYGWSRAAALVAKKTKVPVTTVIPWGFTTNLASERKRLRTCARPSSGRRSKTVVETAVQPRPRQIAARAKPKQTAKAILMITDQNRMVIAVGDAFVFVDREDIAALKRLLEQF